MKKLSEIIKGIDIVEIKGSTDITIENIAYDSRKCGADTLFVSIDGYAVDGHKYIPDAIKNGAKAVIMTKKCDVPENITSIITGDSRAALAAASAAYFDNPSERLHLTGITGTKGKTTTAYLYWKMMNDMGLKTGMIGTLGNYSGNRPVYTSRSTPTTPESFDLQNTFSEMLHDGVTDVIMEATSQALKLKRTECCDFDIGVFLNLTRDHITEREHPDMEDYFNSKAKLMDMCRTALINMDSPYAERLAKMIKVPYYTISMGEKGSIRCSTMETTDTGMKLVLETPWGQKRVETNLRGTFNVYNIMTALAICGIQGVNIDEALLSLRDVSVPGRLEEVKADTPYKILIDYAHTPDSLQNVLEALKGQCKGRLICVFGCGGDRDHGKRPLMGKISCDIADFTIITSDNPRTEDPELIVRDIIEGAKESGGSYIAVTDRREAIKAALDMAQKDDVVILAGKGQETYQMFGDRTIPFDERLIVKEILG